jgi:UDP-N-acetylglucosamine/UDP-N-acetylgalactosamine diphosphorylase
MGALNCRETTEQREYRRKKLVMPDIVETLLGRGVVIPCPAAVEIGADLDVERIASGVVVHAGCKILGAKTSIGPGCVLGAEAPTTVENCQLGAGVALKGGYHAGSVFLDEANMGSGAQVRPGTLLEEEANGAHTVGFKQTVFLSYVTAGSLINFCDALMAGGTSRNGVMLDQSPIFLGGQGGLVGPVRIEYGCVIPAGVIRRKDGLEPAHLLSAAGERVGDRPYRMGVYHGTDRIVANNLIYIGNIRALRSWYAVARAHDHEGVVELPEQVVDPPVSRICPRRRLE